MPRQLSRLTRAVLTGLIVLPFTLTQAGCSLDALAGSLATEVVNSATQYTFEVSQTILANLFQL